MFRFIRSVGVVVVCAITGALAIPASTVSAFEDTFVTINYRGEQYSLFDGPEVEVGSAVTLTAESTVDVPVSFDWQVVDSYVGGRESTDGANVTIRCLNEGMIDVRVYMSDEVGQYDSYESATVYCTLTHVTWLQLGTPTDPTRTVIPLGTTMTYDSVPLSPDVPTVWRATGQEPQSRGRRFTHTFDRLGNVGVEVTAATASGPLKKWVGYTVIAPPTVSVSPAPDGRLKVALGSTMTFDGSGSRSPGGGSLTYQWRTSGVPGVAGSATTFRRRFDTVGNVGVELIVINELGQRAKQRVEFTVFKSEAPVASVTPAPANPTDRMKVTLGSTVTFDGRASRDPDGGVVTYEWRTTGVRGLAGSASTYRRKFTKAGNYGVELTVIDDEGQRAKRWVGITVE